MNKHTMFLLGVVLGAPLAACGDNIHPAVDAGKPDADERFDYTDVAVEVDAAVPAPDAPECDDKHEPKHEHKCQH